MPNVGSSVSQRLLIAAVNDGYLSPATLATLASHHDAEVRAAAAGRGDLPADAARRLVAHAEPRVARELLAAHPRVDGGAALLARLPESTQRAVCRRLGDRLDGYHLVADAVAANDPPSSALLVALACHPAASDAEVADAVDRVDACVDDEEAMRRLTARDPHVAAQLVRLHSNPVEVLAASAPQPLPCDVVACLVDRIVACDPHGGDVRSAARALATTPTATPCRDEFDRLRQWAAPTTGRVLREIRARAAAADVLEDAQVVDRAVAASVAACDAGVEKRTGELFTPATAALAGAAPLRSPGREWAADPAEAAADAVACDNGALLASADDPAAAAAALSHCDVTVAQRASLVGAALDYLDTDPGPEADARASAMVRALPPGVLERLTYHRKVIAAVAEVVDATPDAVALLPQWDGTLDELAATAAALAGGDDPTRAAAAPTDPPPRPGDAHRRR